VHEKSSFIYLQLWALGRAANPETLETDIGGPYPYTSASDVQLTGKDRPPRQLTLSEIKEFVQLYAQAAENAVEAGFDGVEIHGANGYLIDQFLRDVSNKRTDEYGGSIENRSRFALEVVNAIVERIGAERVGIRLSPWGDVQDMKMDNPVPQYTHFIETLARNHPNFAYIHLVNARVSGVETKTDINPSETLDFAKAAWGDRPFLSCGSWDPDSASSHMEGNGTEYEAIVFGRHFISNPDLPKRILRKIPLTPYNRATFYTPESIEGYTDYPFTEEGKL